MTRVHIIGQKLSFPGPTIAPIWIRNTVFISTLQITAIVSVQSRLRIMFSFCLYRNRP